MGSEVLFAGATVATCFAGMGIAKWAENIEFWPFFSALGFFALAALLFMAGVYA